MSSHTSDDARADSGQPATAEERRQAPRFPSDLETLCRPLVGQCNTSWPGRVLDISRNGLALVLHRRFEPGALLTMELEDHGRSIRRSIFARVMHIRPYEAGGWRLGCAFAEELSEEELRAFRAQPVQAGADDCRAWVRFECDMATQCREADNPDAETVPGRILNISPGGIGLVVATAWPKGTLLWLQLPGTPERPGRSVLVRVSHPAREAGDLCLLGCEFAFQLGEEDLQGLLK
jgi:hypothetical protein